MKARPDEGTKGPRVTKKPKAAAKNPRKQQKPDSAKLTKPAKTKRAAAGSNSTLGPKTVGTEGPRKP